MSTTQLSTTQLREAMAVLAEKGIITISDPDPIKVDQVAKSKNGKQVTVGTLKGLEIASRDKMLEVEAANATAALKEAKDEIQAFMGEATELMVEGMSEPIATFRWGALTNFDKDAARKEDPKLIEKHTTTDPEGKRTFRFPGVITTR